ncbi:hypothetical protein FACS1894172_21020 [Spirochaetia bacterium]|nr:hypothetical protein FACS1894172_21020 [Spirochaetia bacterium]
MNGSAHHSMDKDKFIWDAAKDELNKEKYPGISFELATEIFDDLYAVETYDDENSLLDEYRFNVTVQRLSA